MVMEKVSQDFILTAVKHKEGKRQMNMEKSFLSWRGSINYNT